MDGAEKAVEEAIQEGTPLISNIGVPVERIVPLVDEVQSISQVPSDDQVSEATSLGVEVESRLVTEGDTSEIICDEEQTVEVESCGVVGESDISKPLVAKGGESSQKQTVGLVSEGDHSLPLQAKEETTSLPLSETPAYDQKPKDTDESSKENQGEAPEGGIPEGATIEEPQIAPALLTERPTSWKGCCGLIELLKGSQR